MCLCLRIPLGLQSPLKMRTELWAVAVFAAACAEVLAEASSVLRAKSLQLLLVPRVRRLNKNTIKL